MKKVITLCMFAVAFFIGIQSINAQSNLKEIDVQAIKKTESLSKHLDLSEDQKDKVYIAFKEYAISKATLVEGATSDELSIKKIKTSLKIKLKDILTENQFSNYQALQDQEN